MKMRLAPVSGALFWGATGPPESDPATDESAPEPWFSRVRSDLQSWAVRRQRTWEEAPGSWELSPARGVMSSQPKSAPPHAPRTPFPYKGDLPDCVNLFLFCLLTHIPFCLLRCLSGWDLNRPGASEKLRAGSCSPPPPRPPPAPRPPGPLPAPRHAPSQSGSRGC